MESIIRDIKLAKSGHEKISWVDRHMPALNAIGDKLKADQTFKGKTICVSVHLEAKTAYLAEVLHRAGANVIVTGSNPLSTQDDVAAALVEDGLTVYAWYGATDEEYFDFLNKSLDHHPDIIIDDGGDQVHLLHTTRADAMENLLGGTEETTTGVNRLHGLDKAGELKFPMVAANDSYCKYLFDNRYGTGQSTWDGIMRTTNLTVVGKKVVVAGYGWCGKGCAMRAKGLGAHVIVTEVDPIKAIEAVFDGFEVMPMAEAAKVGDIFVTLTGDKVLELFAQIAHRGGKGVSHSVCLHISRDGKLISATVGGQPVDKNRSYRIATLDYVAQGNDEMVAFKAKTGVVAPDSESNNLRFIIMDYLRELASKGQAADSKVEGRIVVDD